MPNVPQLPALPRLVVQLTEDADAFVVETKQQDMLLWEETSHKHKWPAADAAPFLVAWFLAWAALRRMNKLPASMAKWEDFRANAVGVGPAGGDTTPDFPTPSVPASDSLPN